MSLSNFNPDSKAFKKIQKEAEKASKQNIEKETARREAVNKARIQRAGDIKRGELIQDTATATKRKQFAEHNHGTRTPVGDSLPRGPRGGHTYGQVGQRKRVA